MIKVSKDLAIQVYETLRKSPTKYITAEILSQQSGIVLEVILKIFSEYNPIANLDLSINLKEYLNQLEKDLNIKKTISKLSRTPKKVDLPFANVIDFVYEKMTIGGIVDKSIELSIKDLRLLKKIINQEIASQVKHKK